MTKKWVVEIRDAVLEPFAVLLAARRVALRRRRHGRRAARAAELAIRGRSSSAADAPPLIGDAVLCDD
jgi:hypothetical protein